MIRFTILALLTSCARVATPEPTCVTICGMRAYEGDCAELRVFEARTLIRLERAEPTWQADKTCSGLRLFSLVIHPHDPRRDQDCDSDAWNEGAFCYYGRISPERETIELSSTNWGHSALAHELAHAAEMANTGNVGHCRWADHSLRMALMDLSTLPDPSHPEPSCP